MKILCDLDGVVADLLHKWLHFYNLKYDDSLTKADITNWSMHKLVKKECGVKVYDIINKKDFFRDLSPIPGAQKSLKALKAAGHEVLLCSAPSNPDSAKVKYEWVDDILGGGDYGFKFSDIILSHRKDMVRGDVLIDDGPHNIESFPGKTICFSYPYNKGTKADMIADSYLEPEKAWDSIVEQIGLWS